MDKHWQNLTEATEILFTKMFYAKNIKRRGKITRYSVIFVPNFCNISTDSISFSFKSLLIYFPLNGGEYLAVQRLNSEHQNLSCAGCLTALKEHQLSSTMTEAKTIDGMYLSIAQPFLLHVFYNFLQGKNKYCLYHKDSCNVTSRPTICHVLS